MQPFYERDGIQLFCGDNREVIPELDVRVSAVVTDPPYGLSFMGKAWDHGVPGVPFWQVFSEKMLPGAHLVAFGGDRTIHRITTAIEDAGFIIRHSLFYLHGQGFPKGEDFAKDKDASREAGRRIPKPEFVGTPFEDGWNVCLKPAVEPICLARKPLSEKNIAANVLAHGTGALNIDGTRVRHQSEADRAESERKNQHTGYKNPNSNRDSYSGEFGPRTDYDGSAGRWPPNVLLDPDAAAALDQMSGERKSGARKPSERPADQREGWRFGTRGNEASTGGASRFYPVLPIDEPDTLRFFYCPKASRRERDAGLEGITGKTAPVYNERPSGGLNAHLHGSDGKPAANHHPTVKPLALMRWLLTLVTPPDGIVLDPFAGSGSTLVAAAQLGIPAIGVEMDPEYCEIAARRIDHALNERAAGKRWGNGTDASRAMKPGESLNGGAYSGGKRKQVSGDTRTTAAAGMYGEDGRLAPEQFQDPAGRWPSNVLMDREAAAVLDMQSGERGKSAGVWRASKNQGIYSAGVQGVPDGKDGAAIGYGDTGGASRFMTVLDDGDALTDALRRSPVRDDLLELTDRYNPRDYELEDDVDVLDDGCATECHDVPPNGTPAQLQPPLFDTGD